MTRDVPVDPDLIYFISDVHLGSGSFEEEKTRRETLIAFLKSLRGRRALLYIVGDLFDFWFEYRSAVLRQHYTVLYELTRLVESGVRVIYLAGNHDFWLGAFLEEQVGVQTVYGPLRVEHQGRRLFIAHGDGLISKDWRYRLMKRILYNRINIWLFQLVHPDVGVALGRLVSRLSRNHAAPSSWDPRLAYRNLAFSILQEGYDAVIFGHNHFPDFQEQEGGVYMNLGDWIHHFSYGALSGGRFELNRFAL